MSDNDFPQPAAEIVQPVAPSPGHPSTEPQDSPDQVEPVAQPGVPVDPQQPNPEVQPDQAPVPSPPVNVSVPQSAPVPSDAQPAPVDQTGEEAPKRYLPDPVTGDATGEHGSVG
jgi:hypothetical protein